MRKRDELQAGIAAVEAGGGWVRRFTRERQVRARERTAVERTAELDKERAAVATREEAAGGLEEVLRDREEAVQVLEARERDLEARERRLETQERRLETQERRLETQERREAVTASNQAAKDVELERREAEIAAEQRLTGVGPAMDAVMAWVRSIAPRGSEDEWAKGVRTAVRRALTIDEPAPLGPGSGVSMAARRMSATRTRPAERAPNSGRDGPDVGM